MSKLSLTMGRLSLNLKKNAPHIGVAGGVVGLCATIVLSSRATLKAQGVVAEHKQLVIDTREVLETMEGQNNEDGTPKYSLKDFQQDQVVIWSKTAVAMLKLYGPAVVVGSLSIAAIASGHKAMSGRVAALGAAYQVAEATLGRYRDKIQEELGVDIEKELFAKSDIPAAKKAASEEAYEDEEKSKKTKQEVLKHSKSFSRVFENGATNAWRPSMSENSTFLRVQENAFNEKLERDGYVFLNEVYDALGFDRTPEGQIVGWVFTGDEGSNNHISFGLSENADKNTEGLLKELIEWGDFFLDFNVDGVMYDCI